VIAGAHHAGIAQADDLRIIRESSGDWIEKHADPAARADIGETGGAGMTRGGGGSGPVGERGRNHQER
jgi:hypothetical protein